jgi:S1-C subfamily serine protease
MKRTLSCFIILFSALPAVLSAQGHEKAWFDKSGRACPREMAHYYRMETDTAGFFRSYYTINDRPYFTGSITSVAADDESRNVYAGNCTWYYKNGNLKSTRSFNSAGTEHGLSKHFYESGRIWKEIDYEKGRIKGSTYVEYNEDGTRNEIFEDEFTGNDNEWDLYMSDKSTARISDGLLEIVSTGKEGTSRYINHEIDAGEYTIEAVINVSAMKDNDKVGILYGFKDWDNYHYFAISKRSIYIGSYFEGVKSGSIEDMYCSAINPLHNNTIKIITTGSKSYFSVNGEIQFKDDPNKLYGNNLGFIVSGNGKVRVERLAVKQMNAQQENETVQAGNADRDVRATGSGILFSPQGYILTNYHVVDNSSRLVVELTENSVTRNYKAELVIHDKDNDLAIIKIKDERFQPVPLRYAFKESGLVDVGASVFTIGYPHALSGMGKEAKFTDGRVSSKTGYNGSINSFQTTIPVQPGNSGGPVFNDQGQLIGLINATFREADNVSYAIKLNYIRNLIELLSERVDLPDNGSLGDLPLEEKLKVLTGYVALIKVR